LRKSAFLIAILCGVVALVGVGYAVWALTQREEPPRVLVLDVGPEKLTIESSYVSSQARAADAVELVAFFPDFRPAARFDDVSVHTDLSERFQRLVFLTPRPADAMLDPSERTARLYQRFLVETSWSHPGGLTARAFEDASPFEGDELFYVAPEGREFAARCRKPDPSRKTPNTCISVFRLGDLDIEMRFSAGLLSDWEKLRDGARGLIEAARR